MFSIFRLPIHSLIRTKPEELVRCDRLRYIGNRAAWKISVMWLLDKQENMTIPLSSTNAYCQFTGNSIKSIER